MVYKKKKKKKSLGTLGNKNSFGYETFVTGLIFFLSVPVSKGFQNRSQSKAMLPNLEITKLGNLAFTESSWINLFSFFFIKKILPKLSMTFFNWWTTFNPLVLQIMISFAFYFNSCNVDNLALMSLKKFYIS